MAQESPPRPQRHPTDGEGRAATPKAPGFTPGPWITERVGSSGTLAVRVKVNKHEWMNVAEAFEPMTETVEEQAANARLIAAAPDLYAACGIRELDPMTYFGPNAEVGDSWPVEVTLTMGQLRTIAAALAKAGGGR